MLSPSPNRQSWVWRIINLDLNVGGPMRTNSTIPPILLYLVGSRPLIYRAAHQDSVPVREQLGTWTHLLQVLERLILYRLPVAPTPPIDPFTGYRSCNFSRIQTKTSQRPASEALLLLCYRDRWQQKRPFAHGRAPRSRVLKLSERLVNS